MEEVWKPVDFAPQKYSVSNYGRLKNLVRGTVFLGSSSGDAYRRVAINGKKYRVHTLVGRAFLKNPNPALFTHVQHKDRTKAGKLNNASSNLRWGNPFISSLARAGASGVVKRHGRYSPVVFMAKERYYFGEFDTEPEASAVYEEVRRLLITGIYKSLL